MEIHLDMVTDDKPDDAYFDEPKSEARSFDESLLQEPLTVLPTRIPLVFSPGDSSSEAMKAMQREHRGCVVVTEGGTRDEALIGIFTERDVLLRVIDGGRHPSTVTIDEVMTRDPECLPSNASLAWVLNKMSVGGFRHVPAVDENNRPAFVVSVRMVVQFLVDAFPDQILNLPPEYGTERYRDRDGA
jgi:CBS domain-containing protein